MAASLRAALAAATIAALFSMWRDTPEPARLIQVDYCVVDKRVAGKDELGNWHFAWGEMYAPCNQQDRFRQI